MRSRPKDKFKKRYELGEGYPWALGIGAPYVDVRLTKVQRGMAAVPLNWPGELWSVDLPKYRLVLELVEEGG